jgi:hypothetical protein
VKASRRLICGLAVVAALGASVAPARSGVSAAQPHALMLLINGKQLPITLFNGSDHYTPIAAGKLRVEARWQTDLRGTGYRVVISTTEPEEQTYRTCTAGTSCLVSQRVPIVRKEEMSWTVKVIKVQAHHITVLGGFMVCLVGR